MQLIGFGYPFFLAGIESQLLVIIETGQEIECACKLFTRAPFMRPKQHLNHGYKKPFKSSGKKCFSQDELKVTAQKAK